MTDRPAAAAGTFTLGGDLPVTRMGYGAMRITGEGVWGDPPDRQAAIAVLRRAVELGVDLIDTADAYGPFVSEDLIREALHTGRSDDPYDGVAVATKGGFVRTGPRKWHAVGRPEYLRSACEMSLRRLAVERIDLYQLHRVDPQVALEDQLGELVALQQEGKIRHIGLSELPLDVLDRARELAPIVSVQSRYNVLERTWEDVLARCVTEGLAFIPYFPVAVGSLAAPDGPLGAIAADSGATPAQLALAWLLERAPCMLPIPGTSSIAHLEENVAAAAVRLTDEQVAAIDALVPPLS